MKSTIKTFEDACKALKLDAKKVLPDVSAMPKKHQAALIAHSKLIIITEALNEGWQPNWNDDNEWKYYPWFVVKASEKKPAGFGFSVTDFALWGTDTGVGSRLCFRSSELALYAAKQFEKLYIDYFLIQE